MKFLRFVIVLSIVVILFGGVQASKALGVWHTTGGVQILQGLSIETATGSDRAIGELTDALRKYASGDFEGEYDPEGIRGSFTFGDVEEIFNIDATILASAFGIEDTNPSDFIISDFEALYEKYDFLIEIGTGSVKYFVALYNNFPIGETEGLTTYAVDILKDHGKISESLYQDLMLAAIDLESGYIVYAGAVTEEEHEAENKVTGETTISQALSMGVPEEALKQYFNDISDGDALIQNMAKSENLPFGDITLALNEYIEND